MRICSAVLTCAAGFKIYGLITHSMPVTWPTPVILGIAIAELFVAAWLVVSKHAGSNWLIATITFTVLTCAAATLVVLGEADCPCFGALGIPPLGIVALDGILLTWLLASRPAEIRSRQLKETFGLRSEFIGIACVIACVIYATARETWARDGAIAIEPITINCRSSTTRTIPIRITNNSTHGGEVYGGGTSCGCLTLSKMPFTVPAFETVELKLRFRAPDEAGNLNQRFMYYLVHPSQKSVVGDIRGKVFR